MGSRSGAFPHTFSRTKEPYMDGTRKSYTERGPFLQKVEIPESKMSMLSPMQLCRSAIARFVFHKPIRREVPMPAL